MRSLGDPAFFRIFEALAAEANPQARLRRSRWSIGDTEWGLERHTFAGAAHSFTMETCTITKPLPRGWTMLVVKEFWWTADQHKPLRDLRWAKLLSGGRADAIAWFNAHDFNRIPSHSIQL